MTAWQFKCACCEGTFDVTGETATDNDLGGQVCRQCQSLLVYADKRLMTLGERQPDGSVDRIFSTCQKRKF